MKKILFTLFAVMILVVLTAGTMSAGEIIGVTGDDQFFSYVVVTTAPNRAEAISTATISNHNRIIGFTVVGQGASGVASLYDAANIDNATNANIISEWGAAANTADTLWFPFPVKLDNGLAVVVDATTTVVTIYYI